MDKESIEELKKLDVSGYFGIGKLKFLVKDMGHTPEKPDRSHLDETDANVAQARRMVKLGTVPGASVQGGREHIGRQLALNYNAKGTSM